MNIERAAGSFEPCRDRARLRVGVAVDLAARGFAFAFVGAAGFSISEGDWFSGRVVDLGFGEVLAPGRFVFSGMPAPESSHQSPDAINCLIHNLHCRTARTDGSVEIRRRRPVRLDSESC
jgi:hypothetical protein